MMERDATRTDTVPKVASQSPRAKFTDGLSEVALPVNDLRASIDFYTNVVGLVLELESEDGAFLWSGAAGQAQRLILATRKRLARGNAAGEVGRDVEWHHVHYAFQVPRKNLEGAIDHLRSRGVAVSGPARFDLMRATSFFFRDPDGHLVEFWSPDP
jgi:catechol 2,3-dioxygenase-like lactoylglutathione lyase family enzyme